MPIKLIVGLRNPGSQYEKTRHNAGAWFVEALTRHFDAVFKVEKKFHAELAHLELNHHACKTALPLVFMNQSGICVRSICQFYQIGVSELLVAHDDIDLPPGRIKLKTGGGHGGHNGLRDIISQLGSPDFHRLRIGVGHPGHKHLVIDYVLHPPSISERELILEAVRRGVDIMPDVFNGAMSQAMSQLNR